MKKGMMGLSLVLVVGLFSTFAYADGSLDGEDLYGDSISEYSRPWGEDILQYEENAIKAAGKRSRLIEEQSKIDNYKYEINRNNTYYHGHCSNRFSLNS